MKGINDSLLAAGIAAAAAFSATLIVFSGAPVSAQTSDFSQTGQIRAIVSETAMEVSSRQGASLDAVSKLPGDAVKFYFTYSTPENTEKWAALPRDKNWSALSNQKVRLSGSLKNGELSNVSVAPLGAVSKEHLTNPPPTVGLYKAVAVPLTIQTPSADKNFRKETVNLGVTPEAIRHSLFNAPNSVNNFYREASYGVFGFTGVHHPQADVVPVTIQAAISNDCQDQIVNQFTPYVRQRLLEQNIDTTNGSVDLGIIIFNDTAGCPDYPFATRGALGARGVPQWVWIPESWFATGPVILTHEIGHALGGNHPFTMRCADFDDPTTCAYTDAADRDIMTSGGRFGMLPNNYERRRWGWHPDGAFDDPPAGNVPLFDLHSPVLPFVKDNVRRGRFFFRALAGVHAGWDVYPEARRNWGIFESYQTPDEAFRVGIAVRVGRSDYGDPEAKTFLVDLNPTLDDGDAPLRENQQISIGGAVIKCLREHNPMAGTRMKVE